MLCYVMLCFIISLLSSPFDVLKAREKLKLDKLAYSLAVFRQKKLEKFSKNTYNISFNISYYSQYMERERERGEKILYYIYIHRPTVMVKK